MNTASSHRLFLIALSIACACAVSNSYAADVQTTPEVNASSDDFAIGKKAIDSKNWQQAVDSFSKVVKEDPKNADAYNYLGYANRWLGRLPAAFAAYDKALALNPKHKGALEYSGIAYLKSGQKAKAEQQLAKLQSICATCEETKDLAKAMSEAK
jgi:Flp pilus assembly protein TadD